ncbi:16S rRNA (adenine(1518)-N(6)/adenine(1519)-N(6))-dimethyltransferase RsmA [Gilvimarinus sp. F26214L]|uniref:16S rRNA (adenine(1518)-N(6)/adenine(1519)-N(6))- dimethyltransferase RsmA n=1 Tax=Gilvimarinus sp. DZF01 TaxID=3461371 RepID=UPI0040468464
MKVDTSHRARKRFGQNFLSDPGVIHRIIRSIAPRPDDCVVEIGPGQGALTLPLLETCTTVNVVELDRDLVARLETLRHDFPGLQIHQGDALNFDFSQLAKGERSLRVVGNLPYNISTPLIFHLLSFDRLIRDMHFMLQKEVVERMAAAPGSKTYGRLSVMVQYFCRVDNLFGVPPECFLPRPKVDSAIVRLTPHEALPHPVEDFPLLQRLVSTCFQHRRKTLRNSLRGLLPLEIIETLDTDLTIRPDHLSVEDFVALANRLAPLIEQS